MKRYFVRKAVTSGLFVVTIGIGLYVNAKNISQQAKEKHDVDTNLEEFINDHVVGKYEFIESYGYVQTLLNKKEENNFEVIKDTEGKLHFTYFADGAKDISHFVEKMKLLQASMDESNAKLLYVMTPDKVIKGHTKFDAGLPYNYANETADSFLQGLELAKINFFDYRQILLNSKIAPEQLFYKTDHHWTTDTAFWAFGELLEQMTTRYGNLFQDKEYYKDITNYNRIEYKDSFIGSMARKTGIIYAGVDDFSLIYPKFLTDYQFTATSYDKSMIVDGRFEQALVNFNQLRESDDVSDYDRDQYAAYLYGNHGLVHINNKLVNGPKILLIKDSFMVPVSAFLSTVCSDVYMIDPRYYTDSVTEFINEHDIDYVIVSFSPENLTDQFFDFKID